MCLVYQWYAVQLWNRDKSFIILIFLSQYALGEAPGGVRWCEFIRLLRNGLLSNPLPVRACSRDTIKYGNYRFRCLAQSASSGVGALAPDVSVVGVGDGLFRALCGIPGVDKLG